MSDKVNIYCPIHKKYFAQSPSKHLNNEQQYKNQKCKNKYLLPFNFYLWDYNVLIEFDGEQHLHPIELFGGEKSFKIRKKLDNIKNKFAIEHKYNLC